MTITARYPSRCSACGRPISAGEQIEWTKGGPTRHAKCPSGKSASSVPVAQPLASVPGGARIPQGRNRKPGYCERCGEHLIAGAGILEYCEYDTGCPKHMHESGYHVYCPDEAACSARKAGAKAAAQDARKAKIDAALAGLRALTEPIRLSYYDGEYLSGWQVYGAATTHLEALGLAPYVSGWGHHVALALTEALGSEFTGAQAADYYTSR